MTFAFAAAGTGGHIHPALAVARSLVSSGVDVRDIVFFGGNRLERRIVPDAGFEFVQLDVRGLKRSLTVDNLTIPAMVRRAAGDVASTLRERAPGVLTVFGGYVSVPAAMGARKVAMPFVVHEQNAVPGVANRYVARRAERTFVAFAPALEQLKRADVVGNPLDRAFEDFDRAQIRPSALRHYGLDPDRPVVGVFGGSLGAQALNEAAAALASAERGSFSILHLTGVDHHADLARQAADVPHWVTEAFEKEMTLFYAASDLVLSRSGALTASELAATGTPSVVVPLPAGKGYQAMNAHDLERAGGTVIVGQDRIVEVPGILARLIANPERLAAMGDGARSAAKPDATRRVASALREIANA
ncbi:MAG: UDP-N-acetylglucosamine--N-acetylmuramyl-(pentapeptide) pyrophosphoryl-undecaprenol N-acetylglucosamine transferase [Acidimicrobiia bacterium]